MTINERIVFFGRNKNYNVTLSCYKKLLGYIKNTDHCIVETICSDDHHNEIGTLEELAGKNNLSFRSIPKNDVNNKKNLKEMQILRPTIFITVQFPKIFSSELLDIPLRAAINLHRGWPFRGGSIDERVIFNQRSTYSLILHHMDYGIDTGNIIGKINFQILPNETGYSLVKKADTAGKKLFVKYFLSILGQNIPKGEKQILENTEYGSKNSLSNKIDFSMTSSEIEKLCRAFHHPRKKGVIMNNIFLIPPIITKKFKPKSKPSTITSLTEKKVTVTTKNGSISVEYCHTGDKNPIFIGNKLKKMGFKVGYSLNEKLEKIS